MRQSCSPAKSLHNKPTTCFKSLPRCDIASLCRGHHVPDESNIALLCIILSLRGFLCARSRRSPLPPTSWRPCDWRTVRACTIRMRQSAWAFPDRPLTASSTGRIRRRPRRWCMVSPCALSKKNRTQEPLGNPSLIPHGYEFSKHKQSRPGFGHGLCKLSGLPSRSQDPRGARFCTGEEGGRQNLPLLQGL